MFFFVVILHKNIVFYKTIDLFCNFVTIIFVNIQHQGHIMKKIIKSIKNLKNNSVNNLYHVGISSKHIDTIGDIAAPIYSPSFLYKSSLYTLR